MKDDDENFILDMCYQEQVQTSDNETYWAYNTYPLDSLVLSQSQNQCLYVAIWTV